MVNKIILLFILYNFEVANVLLYLKKFLMKKKGGNNDL